MAVKKGGLGRGLNALLGEKPITELSPEIESGSKTTLPIRKIEPNRAQPRTEFDPEALEELAESIRTHGLIQPIVVRKQDNGYYQIIAGERRWRASRLAKLNEVPVVILDVTDDEAMELALIENLQREDLNPIEEAGGYQRLMKDYGLTQEECAVKIGKSRSAVANALRLLQLPKNVQKQVSAGELSSGHARALLPLTKASAIEAAADKVISAKMSVRETERYVVRLQKVKDKPVISDKKDEVDYQKEAEKDLTEKLGRKVRILSGKRSGSISIDYYGNDDLINLIEELKKLEK